MSYVPPGLDTLWAGLQGVTLAAAANTNSTDWERRHRADRTATIVGSAIQMAAFGASAAYGYYQVTRCMEAQRGLRQRLNTSGLADEAK